MDFSILYIYTGCSGNLRLFGNNWSKILYNGVDKLNKINRWSQLGA